MSAVPKVRDDLTIVELDGEAVIYDEETAELHRLNPTATIVFGLCDGTTTIGEMSTEIAEVFSVPIEQLMPQIQTLVRQLRRAKLLAYVPNRTQRTPEAP